jgi:multiple sugar transport system permease protein
VMVVNIWQITPFFFLVLVSGLQSIPLEQYEAAKIDGANPVQEFRFITLSWIKPIIVVVLLITIIDAFKVFDLVFILTGGGPGNRTEVISYYIYRQSFQLFNVGYGSALAFVAFSIEALVAVAFLVAVRQQRIN